jgi:hypothetical protein
MPDAGMHDRGSMAGMDMGSMGTKAVT